MSIFLLNGVGCNSNFQVTFLAYVVQKYTFKQNLWFKGTLSKTHAIFVDIVKVGEVAHIAHLVLTAVLN